MKARVQERTAGGGEGDATDSGKGGAASSGKRTSMMYRVPSEIVGITTDTTMHACAIIMIIMIDV